jgi:hypothetical protein
MEFEKYLNSVPDFPDFYTVDELDQRTKDLAEKYPKSVRVFVGGRSRNGHPIHVLKIGKGRSAALFFGCPHPNEPIGSMMVDYLSQLLAEDENLLGELDFTFYLIKSIDPDGTKLNEGWFKGPFTPEHYARHFYRPASFDQIEWTFPISYKTLKFDRPLPETKILMELIQREKPNFIYSLHNAGFGGVYYYISSPRPSLYPIYQDLAKRQNLPLSLGEPEMPYAVKYADGVYQMPITKDSYDYLEKHLGKDPASVIKCGTSTFDYAKNICDPFTLVCEVPYFYDPRIEDQSPTDTPRREAILRRLEHTQGLYDLLLAKYERIEKLLTTPSPFRTAVEHFLQVLPDHLKAEKKWAKEDKELNRPATVAEVFDNLVVHPFYNLLVIGMFLRLIDAEKRRRQTDALQGAWSEVDELFSSWKEEMEKNMDYQVIPIKKLVAVQLGAGLESLASIGRELKV